jgi:acetyl esterase/lipase
MEIRIDEDIRYAESGADKDDCLLDLYRPEPTGERAPAIVVIHGGGWFAQHRKGKRERSIATDLARAGFVAASIEYRLVDIEHPSERSWVWPRNLEDCKAAVSFLRRHAGEYGIDPARIGAIGGSAGAHLSAMIALTSTGSASVEAVVYLYGVCDIARWLSVSTEPRLGMRAAEIMLDGLPEEKPQAYLDASPVGHLDGRIPPMLLVHGDADEIIPCSETIRFQRLLSEAGADSSLIIVPGAPHSFDLHPAGRDIESDVIAFFDRHLRGNHR